MDQRVSANPRGTALSRYCLCLAAARGDFMHAYELSKQFTDSPEVAATFKALVSPMSVADSQSAAPLAMYGVAQEAIQLLLPMTILGKMMFAVRHVPFRMLTSRATTVAASEWVGEGLPIPARAATFDTVRQEHYKAATIVILTRDLLRFSSPPAEQELRNQLLAGVAQFLDQQLLDKSINPTPDRPGALTWNAETVTSSGSTAAQVLADCLALIGKLVAQNCQFKNTFWIMRPGTAAALASKTNTAGNLAFPLITANGGTLLGFNVITSANAPASITLIDVSEVMLSDDNVIDITATDEAAVQLDDNPSDTGSPQIRPVSLWQNNLFGLRCIKEVAWQMAHSTGSVDNSPIDYKPLCVATMTVSY